MTSVRTAAVFLCLTAAAALLRVPRLAERPMHCDEAVNADKFGVLLEHGRYEYSRQDYHGPTLYYLTLIPAEIQGAHRYVDLNEVTLRIVPACLGVLLAGVHIFLIPYLGLRAAMMAGLLAAVSPAMVYYSRYYIHEIPLVFLTFCAMLFLLQYARERRAIWAIGTGVFIGLMYATKETVFLQAGSMLLAGMGAVLFERPRVKPAPVRHLVLALVAMLAVAAILMSSFLSHPRGILDSLEAYRTYFSRGSGINTFHVHPWYYYFGLILYFHSAGHPVWSEAFIAVFALPGLWAAFRGQTVAGVDRLVLRFIGLYTVLMIAIYSLIPYKAPWNLLGFWQGVILLAGVGVVWLGERCRSRGAAIVLAGLAVAGVAHLGWLAWESGTRYGADPANPWVYAHTGTDVFRIAQRMDELAAAYPGGYALPVQIVTHENLWPLPWYLRRFSNVQWSDSVAAFASKAPAILATPEMEPALVSKLYEQPPPGQREMYMNMFDRYTELRPRVEIRGYVSKPLWDDWRQRGDGR